ncbi:flippase-like domain-containing protein [Tsukamurella sputi]|uniref:Flippase-like domain-containing protein n=1 Tax=Tsukamurella sputi TaxID=2591848 RepID=A0A5C5RIL0_9ACTN|nr:lysylphosphatidylglycerol synthase transmembrane domain-containing protein [Tsukamurella sputi]TWS22412.1 flippase-like domain-containing protein [Tsukamurella sputi]
MQADDDAPSADAPSADAPSASAPTKDVAATRRRLRWVRRVLLLVIAIILGVEAYLFGPTVSKSIRELEHIRWEWVLACVIAVFFSMDSFAQVTRVLLRSAGVKVTQRQALSLQMASNSVSQTLPGGQVLAPTLVYRRTRLWGASRVVAAWQIVMSGLLMSAGLAVLGLVGALLAGAKSSPYSVMFSVGMLVVFIVLVQYVASHPDGLYVVGARLIRWINDLRNKPEDTGLARLREVIEQLQAVKMSRRYGAEAFGWSMFNWVADVACLTFACYAVGDAPGLAALAGAYAASKVVNTISPIPGGLGLVEAALVPALVLAGMPASQAFTATILYRLISYVLVVVVGWIVIFAGYRSYRATLDVDPDAATTDKNGESAPEQEAPAATEAETQPSLDDDPPNPGPLDESGPSTGTSGS